jgi:hypothetical protein
MALIDVETVVRDGMSDPEFRREMRFFDGRIKVGVAGDQTTLSFADGALAGVEGEVPNADCKIVIDGTREQWENLLAPYPKPFYQCLQTTAVKHGLKLSATNETFAYLPALNRLVVLLRQARNGR